MERNDWCRIGEMAYQRLKEVTTLPELLDKLEITPRPEAWLRLGRTLSKAMSHHPCAYSFEVSAERKYVSAFALHVDGSEHFRVVMDAQYHQEIHWQIPMSLLAPTIFAYYASPGDRVYEELLTRLSVSSSIVR